MHTENSEFRHYASFILRLDARRKGFHINVTQRGNTHTHDVPCLFKRSLYSRNIQSAIKEFKIILHFHTYERNIPFSIFNYNNVIEKTSSALCRIKYQNIQFAGHQQSKICFGTHRNKSVCIAYEFVLYGKIQQVFITLSYEHIKRYLLR